MNELTAKYSNLVEKYIDSVEKRVEEMLRYNRPPRKHIGAFCFYSMIRRYEIRLEKPKLIMKKILKIVSKEWRAMDDIQREPYLLLSQIDYAYH